jgi:hypothetical protein
MTALAKNRAFRIKRRLTLAFKDIEAKGAQGGCGMAMRFGEFDQRQAKRGIDEQQFIDIPGEQPVILRQEETCIGVQKLEPALVLGAIDRDPRQIDQPTAGRHLDDPGVAAMGDDVQVLATQDLAVMVKPKPEIQLFLMHHGQCRIVCQGRVPMFRFPPRPRYPVGLCRAMTGFLRPRSRLRKPPRDDPGHRTVPIRPEMMSKPVAAVLCPLDEAGRLG